VRLQPASADRGLFIEAPIASSCDLEILHRSARLSLLVARATEPLPGSTSAHLSTCLKEGRLPGLLAGGRLAV